MPSDCLCIFSFHVDSVDEHPEVFSRTLKDARTVFGIASKMGFQMTMLDVGGGLRGGVGELEQFRKVIYLAIRISRHGVPVHSLIFLITGNFWASCEMVLYLRYSRFARKFGACSTITSRLRTASR